MSESEIKEKNGQKKFSSAKARIAGMLLVVAFLFLFSSCKTCDCPAYSKFTINQTKFRIFDSLKNTVYAIKYL